MLEDELNEVGSVQMAATDGNHSRINLVNSKAELNLE